jgi:hypothetical protein
MAIAMQLDCPTEDERARPLTVDALKEEILVNCGEDTLLIFPEAMGLKQDKPEHTQYVVIMPVIIAMLFSFAVVRFIGMGTGNKGLYRTHLSSF